MAQSHPVLRRLFAKLFKLELSASIWRTMPTGEGVPTLRLPAIERTTQRGTARSRSTVRRKSRPTECGQTGLSSVPTGTPKIIDFAHLHVRFPLN
jgi:hypothetical protein